MRNIELVDLCINLQYYNEEVCHLVRVYYSPVKRPFLPGMFEVMVWEDKKEIGQFTYVGEPDVASARLFAIKAVADTAGISGL